VILCIPYQKLIGKIVAGLGKAPELLDDLRRGISGSEEVRQNAEASGDVGLNAALVLEFFSMRRPRRVA